MQALEMMFFRRVSSKTLRPLQRSRLFGSNSGYDFSKAIQELNKEMESVFGEPPKSSLAGSIDNQSMAHDSESAPTHVTQSISSSGLTHTDSRGEAQMVDISPKEITKRVAIASCKVILGQKVFDLVSANQVEKGDVLGVAKIAGICGAKQTSNLIPLCHNINLSHVALNLTLSPQDLCVEIESEAASNGKTGVEMEALTAVTIAGLTVYDMCKAASKDILITDIRLESKSGGKSGDWSRKK
ncbi:cyclic pyranopterin monophosphate synthase accessory, mitochondrial [Olea europaea subsp. europaea]|uniref:cyclic pyranopterin monophosphate synthase n=2 Tax=Olea europaea subsp. europaea TaxID=158383 RepID=A0A8S0QA52_OLEEU|nr:cyclic pyranopterin monophosphate synthase accessory, mitochondrial [Olea europaea subsp. europaea]